uniref:hypothetical protein n=1 Tax=Phaeostrophion irregulare TaxID=243268 RepID=UPI002E7634D9|nr:hypothetical protein V2492_pgp022 [Phaeostrophion irregulare]WAM64364.1 hypothetical protein [Phaeostrophion irregulare]
MNALFPLVYSLILFLVLCSISVFLIKQVINTQKTEKKIIFLQERININQFSYHDTYKLGQLYLKKKLFNKAILLFRKSLDTWDSNDKIGLGSLYNTLGFTYFNLKQYEFAIYYYQIAIKILPDYTLALKNLAYTYEKLTWYNKADKIYQKSLYLNPIDKVVLSRKQLLKRKLNLK